MSAYRRLFAKPAYRIRHHSTVELIADMHVGPNGHPRWSIRHRHRGISLVRHHGAGDYQCVRGDAHGNQHRACRRNEPSMMLGCIPECQACADVQLGTRFAAPPCKSANRQRKPYDSQQNRGNKQSHMRFGSGRNRARIVIGQRGQWQCQTERGAYDGSQDQNRTNRNTEQSQRITAKLRIHAIRGFTVADFLSCRAILQRIDWMHTRHMPSRRNRRGKSNDDCRDDTHRQRAPRESVQDLQRRGSTQCAYRRAGRQGKRESQCRAQHATDGADNETLRGNDSTEVTWCSTGCGREPKHTT